MTAPITISSSAAERIKLILSKEGKGLVGTSWRRWANLSETGRLDFRDGPESAATDDAIEMVEAVRVVHAKAVATHSRGLIPGTVGLRMLTDGVGAVTDLTGSVVSGAAKGAKGGFSLAGGGLALAGDAAKGGISLAGDAAKGGNKNLFSKGEEQVATEYFCY